MIIIIQPLSMIALSVIGFLLSIYTFYVELRMRKSKDYKAICDISKNFSCTKAFSTKYGSILGLSNSIPGMFFYFIIFILTYSGFISLVFYLSILAMVATVYLAYISYFKLRNFCVVCNGVYIINLLLLIFSYLNLY